MYFTSVGYIRPPPPPKNCFEIFRDPALGNLFRWRYYDPNGRILCESKGTWDPNRCYYEIDFQRRSYNSTVVTRT